MNKKYYLPLLPPPSHSNPPISTQAIYSDGYRSEHQCSGLKTYRLKSFKGLPINQGLFNIRGGSSVSYCQNILNTPILIALVVICFTNRMKPENTHFMSILPSGILALLTPFQPQYWIYAQSWIVSVPQMSGKKEMLFCLKNNLHTEYLYFKIK